MPSIGFMVPEEQKANIKEFNGVKELYFLNQKWRISRVKLTQGDMYQAYCCFNEEALKRISEKLTKAKVKFAVYESE